MDVPARKLPRWLAGYVAALEFDSPGRPLDIAELGARFKLSPQRTREIAYALAQIGWLRRVSHGVYEFIPAAAVYPSASNWLPFAHVSAPYFVSGLAAAQVLRLTTQLPSRQLVVIPQRTRAPKAFSRAGMRIVRVTPDRHYGWDEIDVEGVSVRVASTARLVIDLVEHPDWFDGTGEAARVIERSFRRSGVGEIVETVLRWPSSAAARRVGWWADRLLGTSWQGRSALLERARDGGAERLGLVPGVPARGPALEPWRITVNVDEDVLAMETAIR